MSFRILKSAKRKPLESWPRTGYFQDKSEQNPSIQVKSDLWGELLSRISSAPICSWSFPSWLTWNFSIILLFALFFSSGCNITFFSFISTFLCIIGASLVAQRLKRLPAMQETWVQSLGQEDPLEKEMATHSSILAWRIPWMEEPGGLQSTGSQRVGHDWATSLSFCIISCCSFSCEICVIEEFHVSKYDELISSLWSLIQIIICLFFFFFFYRLLISAAPKSR